MAFTGSTLDVLSPDYNRISGPIRRSKISLLVLFLINSFVLREKKAGKKTTEGSKLCKGTSLCDKPSINSVRVAIVDRNKPAQANMVFKSMDGGQTWQAISEGLPEPVIDVYGVGRNDFFADDNGSIYLLRMGYITINQILKLLFGKKIFSLKNTAIFPMVRPGSLHTIAGVVEFSKKTNGTGVWSPVFTNFQEKRVGSVFETAGGTIFIGSNRGLFKSANSGKSWKHVGGWGKMAESNGVLLATSQGGIVRSTDYLRCS